MSDESRTVPLSGAPPSRDPTADPSTVVSARDGDHTPSGEAAGATAPERRPADVPGYDLHGEIGVGGMGAVYRAKDRTLQRDVAVKVLRSHFPADGVSAHRFREEARITGQLQHPGIPPVHQVGATSDGRPFLAMKLIKGQTLAVLLKERADPAVERGRFVAVFEQVAQAVGYAHAHHVVHRDLKPTNVMVGAFGEVQVMDWGLAKVLPSHPGHAAGSSATDESTLDTEIRSLRGDDEATRAGSVLGTPAYMPPEQAIGAVDQIDERSDVFGLGAILCVLLTGEPPFVGDDSEAVRQLSATRKLGDAFARLDGCGAEPELVALCKRCLSAEKADRPAAGGAVAKAVAELRAAADERARRAELDRRSAEVAAVAERTRRRQVARWAAAVAVVLATGAGVSAWQMVRANGEADRANGEAANARIAEGRERDAANLARTREQQERDARATADEVAAFMQVVFTGEGTRGEAGRNRDAAKKRTVKEAMDQAAKTIEGKFADRPEVEAAVRGTIGNTYQDLGAYAEAQTQLEQALAIRERTLGPDHPDTLTSVNSLALLLGVKGDEAAAEPLIKRVLAIRERTLGPDHPDTLTSVTSMGVLLKVKGDFAAAEPFYRRALTGQEKVRGPDHIATLGSVLNLGYLLKVKGDYAAAEPLYRRAMAGLDKALGPGHPATLQSVHDLGVLLREKADLAAAEPLLRRALDGLEKALGPDHPSTLNSVNDLAILLYSKGDLAAAEPLYRRAMAGREKARGPDHPDTLGSVGNLALLLQTKGDRAAAEPLHRRALAIQEKALGPDHPDTLTTVYNLALLLQTKRDYAAAEPLYRRALAGREKALGPDHPQTLFCVINLGLLLQAKGDYAAAEPLYRRILAIREKALGPDHPDTLGRVNNLGVLLYLKGDLAAAEPLYRRALAGKEKALGPGHPSTLQSVNNLGVLLREKGDLAAAEPLLRRAVAGFEKALGPDHPDTLQSVASLALLYVAMRRHADAVPLFERAVRGYAKRTEMAGTMPLLRGLLGLSLLATGRPADAEPHLLAGYDALSRSKTFDPVNRNRLRQVAQGLVELYATTNQPAKAAEWRAKLAALPPAVAPPPRRVREPAPPPRPAK